MPVKLGFSSVKTGVRSVAGNYWIHAAKIGIYLSFEREIRILIPKSEIIPTFDNPNNSKYHVRP